MRGKMSTTGTIKYSYSGADCKAVAYYDTDLDYGTGASAIINLDSLATISYSIYEAKSPVRALGHRAVKGYTKGIRTIAGSMVFLVIEDHPLAELVGLDRLSKAYSKDAETKGVSFRSSEGGKRFISTMLEPFNIGLFYKTEVAFNRGGDKGRTYRRNFRDGAHLVISKINIISEGMVTSVNDMVTEITMQFVAEDIFNLEATDSMRIGETFYGKKNATEQYVYVYRDTEGNSFNFTKGHISKFGTLNNQMGADKQNWQKIKNALGLKDQNLNYEKAERTKMIDFIRKLSEKKK
jgi:hypothetical protein